MKNSIVGFLAGTITASISFVGIAPMGFGLPISLAIAISAGVGLFLAICRQGTKAILLVVPGFLLGTFVALGMYWMTGTMDGSSTLKLLGFTLGPVTIISSLVSIIQSINRANKQAGN